MQAVLIARMEDLEYRIVEASAQSSLIFDTTADAVLGANLLEVLDHRGGLGPLRATICDAVASNEACNAYVRTVVDGQLTERNVAVVPAAPEPNQRAIRATIADGDHMLTEGQPQSLDAIVSVISHELRSPLNATYTWASLLELDPKPATIERAIGVIRESVRTQTRLIDDLIDVSRGPSPASANAIDLSALVAQSVAAVRASLASTINVDAKASKPLIVPGDEVQLGRVIRHLVTNAAAAMRENGGSVGIDVTHDAGHALVTVSDAGHGLTSAQIVDTFRPFSRNERRFGGAGLGLAVVRTLVARHGGSVCARSAGPGLGATFTFSLPLRHD